MLRAEDPRLEWGATEQLLAAVVDNIAFLRYEQSGCKGRKPKPVKRPEKKDAGRRLQDRTVHGMSPERVASILALPRG